jgi:hypothetical protein
MTTNLMTEPVTLERLGVEDKPDGPVAAAILAGGVGAFSLGLFSVLAEMSASFKTFLTLSEGVGALSGKAVFTVVVWLAAWLVLHLALRTKKYDVLRATAIALVLVAIGLVTTIPPIFTMFAPAE